MAKAATIFTQRYAALAPIGAMEDGKFIIKKPGQTVDLSDEEHEKLFAKGKVGEEPIDAPAAKPDAPT